MTKSKHLDTPCYLIQKTAHWRIREKARLFLKSMTPWFLIYMLWEVISPTLHLFQCWDPWTARRSNQSILKEISLKHSLEGLMLKLKLQYLGHLMQRTDSLEKTLMLGKIEGRGWDSYLASLTQWTWVWAGSGNWWWTGKPGVLQSTGSQRLSDWTETQRGRKTSRHTWQIDFTSNPILICGRRCLVPATRKGFKITAGLSRPWCCDLIVMSSTDAEVESRGLCGAKVTSVGPKQKIQVPLQNENLPSYFLWYK